MTIVANTISAAAYFIELQKSVHMHRYRISLSLIVLLALFGDIHSQYESSSFNLTGMAAVTPFARDYQSLSVNPANLDLETGYDRKTTLGFFDLTASLHTELLTKEQLFNGLNSQTRAQPLSFGEQMAKVDELTMKPTVIDADLLIIGASFRSEKNGAFAFTMRERFDFYSRIDRTLTELLWLGNQSSYFDSLIVQASSGADSIIARPENFDPSQYNILSAFISSAQALSGQQLLGNTAIGLSWLQEFNFGYGKRIINNADFEFHLGINAKYLLGQGIIEINGEKKEAFCALSPLLNPFEASEQYPSSLPSDASKLKPVGQGFGFDIGGTFLLKQHFIVNAALNDIGQMRWDGNLFELGTGKVTGFNELGIETLELNSVLNSFDGIDAILNWKGTESRITRLNTTVRLGLGFEELQKFRIGFDVIAPLNDNQSNIQQPAINVGIEVSPWPWLHLQTGFSEGGNYGSRMPAGIYFTAGKGAYEMGFATRDVLTYFNDDNPTLSMALGFLRFRF
jgi:hypothetical protein